MNLPPKRFEPIEDPKYDQIRPRKWFKRLAIRKWQLALLAQAYKAWQEGGISQQKACESFKVDRRELCDYYNFVQKKGRTIPQEYQLILNEAYERYSLDYGKRPLRSYIRDISPRWGILPRRVEELWEVDPYFYPTSTNKSSG